MSGTLHVICSHSDSCVCLRVCGFVCLREQKNERNKSEKCKKAAKFIVCYFQVSFWCRTVEYSVTVICDWVLFHSNLIYINASIGIPFTTFGSWVYKNSNNSSPHSVLVLQSLTLIHSLSLCLSNPRCITFRDEDNVK